MATSALAVPLRCPFCGVREVMGVLVNAGVLASFVLLPAADVLLGRDLTPETEVPPLSRRN